MDETTTPKTNINSDTAERHINALRALNESFFYGYHVTVEDYARMAQAVKYFEDAKKQVRKKLIKEGLL